MLGKRKKFAFTPAFCTEHLGADIGLLGDSVIDDKGLNIEGIGANLRVAQLVLRLQPRPPRRLTGAGDQQGFVFQPLQRGDIGMGQQPRDRTERARQWLCRKPR